MDIIIPRETPGETSLSESFSTGFPGFLCSICNITLVSLYVNKFFIYFRFQFSSNAELIITNTDPALCTSAPATGFKIPRIASVIARKFNPMEKLILHLIVIIIRLDHATRCGNSLTSSSTSAISAASTAMSLPTPPMAIPTSARFRAGASLTPSPIMQTASSFF